MRKILKLAKREYLAGVRTKGFLVALIVMPIFMGGSGIVFALLKDRVDTQDKHIAVIDRSGIVADTLRAAVEQRNAEVVHDPATGKKVRSAYFLELIPPDDQDPAAQRLAMSDRVRQGELQAFIEIGANVLHPSDNPERNRIGYHAPNAVLDEMRGWLGVAINTYLRRERACDLGVGQDDLHDLFYWVAIDPLGLVTIDRASGEVREARRSGEAEAVLVPLVLPMLLFIMILMTAVSQLSAVVEEKTQRIAEVMLGSVQPFQFMLGKVLGGVGVALTGVTVYVIIGLVIADRLDVQQYVPYHVLPWFFAFVVLAILMLGAVFSALGAACNDSKEASAVTFPAMLPVLIPLFVMMPIIQHPLSPLATWLSLIPPFTPMVMLMRIASPAEIPAWQPWVGLLLLAATALLATWVGGRIFRVAILMQGTPPKLGNLIRWALRG